jgi:NitT/TauT family transport system permease protein
VAARTRTRPLVVDWISRLSMRALPVVALVGVWWVVSATGLVSDTTVISPPRLAQRFITLWERGYQHVPLVEQIAASMLRTLAGFLAAALLGIPLGLVMGMSKTARWLLSPLLALVRPIPAIAFIPLFIIWFGIGEFSKVLVIFLSSFLYITVTTEAAVYSIPIGWQRVALALSWALVVAAELIGAQRGLGFMIMDASVFFRVEDVYVGIICIGVIGLALNGLLSLIEARLCHWRGK